MPTAAPATPPAASQEAELRSQLRQRLLALPYRAFLQVVIQLLRHQGYASVRPAGRHQWKGRNQDGGWDAEATMSARGMGALKTIVQAKQFATMAVHQRQVDELRGSCLRAGAQQALLVTLSTFSPVAKKAANLAQPVVPVGLIDGVALMDLLIEYGIGITLNKDRQWRLDTLYFDTLQEQFDREKGGIDQRQQKEQTSQGSGQASQLTVIVQIGTSVQKVSKVEVFRNPDRL